MKSFALVTLAATSLAAVAADPPVAGTPDTRCYELRVYTAAPGKLDALHARFRDHTTSLFEKHGMTNVGYWVPIDNKENKLYYLLAHESVEARAASFKAFGNDPAWKSVHEASEKDGPLVSKIDSTLLHAAPFSPQIKASKAEPERVFELRTYTAAPGRLRNLLARFRDHTIGLFEKHGMTNFGYWLLDKDQPGADVTLVYLLAHKSPEAAAASFKAFVEDPLWVAAREESEKYGGGSLTVPGGVKSVMMKPTDYSKSR